MRTTNRTWHASWILVFCIMLVAGAVASAGAAPSGSGVRLCGVVDANRVLVDFAVDRPDVEGHRASATPGERLTVTFDASGGYVEVSVPDGGWDLHNDVAVVVDLENIGPRPVTVLGTLNHRVPTASLVRRKHAGEGARALFCFDSRVRQDQRGRGFFPGQHGFEIW